MLCYIVLTIIERLTLKVLQNLFADVLELKSHLHILKTKVSIRKTGQSICVFKSNK